MEKMSAKQVRYILFINIHYVAEEIANQKDIFESKPSPEDYDQIFFYAQALFEIHDLTHGKHFDSNFFLFCTDKYCEKIKKERDINEFEWWENANESLLFFDKAHANFLNGSSEQDSLMKYIKEILSRFNSCTGTSAFSFAGTAFASLLPDIFEYIGKNYDYLVSSWDKSLDVVEEPSVQSNDDFIVETYQKETPQSNATQPQQKNESVKNKKMRTIFLILVLIGCFAASIYFYTKNTALAEEIKHLEFLLSQAEYREENKQETIKQYKTRIDSMSDEYEFFHNHAVIVTETGYRYHSYGCPHISGRSFYIFNTENAKYQGYTPCLDCNPPQ